MRDFIGITHPLQILSMPESTKRAALLFNKLFVPQLDAALSVAITWPSHEHIVSEIEWLLAEGILVDGKLVDAHPRGKLTPERKRLIKEAEKDKRELENAKSNPSIPEEAKITMEAYYQWVWMVRAIHQQFRERLDIDSCPFFPFNIYNIPDSKQPPFSKKNDVYRLIIDALPIPDDSTPWEQIIEFRDDSDSQQKLLDLRNWVNEVARGDFTPIEIEQKVEYLLSQYKRHLELHKMKISKGTWETIIVSSAELLEDLAKFKWGKIAKSLFAIKHRKIALLEGELNSPGSEVAYIIKAKEAFPVNWEPE